ncbi:nucleotidyltransferase family protein [Zavarzinia compransoris]|uniref:nucleotidyltransferase family protein n=1 Tax=Zavarzinia marina TaxID=2911065 RepID=UPI001F41E09B|nr:nucleotidyltransferase family protein [Zavarzinia marina]MCF4164176.1 nucleotidyltransferase family protein [Zavarzinia marina]
MIDWHEMLIRPDWPLRRAVEVLNSAPLKICLVADGDERLVGTVTDGDVRRALLAGRDFEAPVAEVMNTRPMAKRVGLGTNELFALYSRCRQLHIRHLPVTDAEGRLIGLEPLDRAAINADRRPGWVMLMAGGFGKRLAPLTDDTPKPMLTVGDRPILQTILESFVRHGFRRFFISVHYQAQKIEDHFGDGSRFGVEIRYVHEDEPLGTAGALGLVRDAVTEPIVVANGDLLTNVDYDALLAYHHSQRADITLCVREYRVKVPYGTVDLAGRLVARITEKPELRFLVNAAVYVLSPEALREIEPGAALDMPTLIDRVGETGGKVVAFPMHEYWLDVGQKAEFAQANSDYQSVFGAPAASVE